MLQSARMGDMEKPLPLTPNQIKGTPIVTISLVENTDLEDLQPPKVAGAPQPTKPIKSSRQRRIRQFILSFTRRINRIVGPKQTNKPNGSTVLWNVFGFIALLGLGSVAVIYPRRPMLITIGIVAFLVSCLLAALVASDLRSRSILPLLDLFKTSTNNHSTDPSRLPEKLGQHHPDNLSDYTFLRAALCFPLVSKLEQDRFATQPRYCSKGIPLSTASTCAKTISRMKPNSQPSHSSKTRSGLLKPHCDPSPKNASLAGFKRTLSPVML